MNRKELNYLKSLNACSDAVQWAKQFKTINEAWQVCERGDWMMWLLKKRGISKEQSVTLAVKFAERVLPIFEQKYPKDKRPRKAINAARVWLKNPTEKNRIAAAAAAAAAAAYDAAFAAAYTAYTAAYAAYAAADAAAYAAYTAAAAAYAASAAAYAECKAQSDIIREIIPKWEAQ